ncbi:hypothetical protein QYF36_005162 [Acer negundo]|nr:hypothetical protein QYF36_005162 [Acer negundo]
MRILLGKHSVRFSKVEFCQITGLKFRVIPDTARYDMYDAVKLCLLFMLNWILMGVDERDKVPVWQWRLVEDLDAFDAFPWGTHMYRWSIYCFKHALDGRQERFEQRQQERGADVHTTETYNIYGLLHALLIFVFEVIPELGNKKCGTRRAISELPHPCILKWELSQRPWGRKLDGIFTERPVGFTLPRQPRPGGDSDPKGRGESPERYRRGWDRKFAGVMDDVQSLLVDVMKVIRKSDEKRGQQHQELLDMIRVRTGTHQHGTDEQAHSSHVMTERAECTPPSVDPSSLRLLKRSKRNSPTHQRDTGRESDTRRERSSSERSPSRGDTRRERSSTHHSPPHRDTRRQRSFSQRSPPHSNPLRQRSFSLRTSLVESSSEACSPRQIQCQLRVRRPGWQLMTPYTDPCRPKKPRTRPALSVHAFKPYDLGDVDIHIPVGVTLFQTNFMDLEDTHIDAYLLILWKRQRAYPTVYAQRFNVLDSQFYSWLDIQWERMFGSGVAAPPKEWSMLKHKWYDDDLKTVRGLVPSGNRPWHTVDWVKFHSNRTKDDVTYSLSKKAFRMSIMDGSHGGAPTTSER